MASDRSGWLLPEPIRQFPADLVAVMVLTLLTVLIISLPSFQETPFRIFALPFVFFLPGYVFVAALFPEHDKTPTDDEARSRTRKIDPIKRIGLSFGTSTVIIPLLGLTLNFTAEDIRFTHIILGVSAFTIGCAVIAAVRRWKLPSEERFSVPYHDWVAAVHVKAFNPGNRTNAMISIILVLSIVLILGSSGFAVTSPQQGDQFTEFYLLTQDNDGKLVATNYPEEFIQGEHQSMIVAIENNEHEIVEYTVVIQLERIEGEGEEAEVVEREELDRFETTLAHREKRRIDHDITPPMIGKELRLTYLLYDNEVPKRPTRLNAYRDLHLWITVEETDIQEPIEIPSGRTDIKQSNQTDTS